MTNNKVTIAKVGQKVDDYIEHNNNTLSELKNDFKDNFKEIFDKLDALPDKFDGRYANKTTQQIVYGLVTVILVAVASSVVYLVVV